MVIVELPFKTVLVHDPVALLPFGGSASVEDERLLHAHEGGA